MLFFSDYISSTDYGVWKHSNMGKIVRLTWLRRYWPLSTKKDIFKVLFNTIFLLNYVEAMNLCRLQYIDVTV